MKYCKKHISSNKIKTFCISFFIAMTQTSKVGKVQLIITRALFYISFDSTVFNFQENVPKSVLLFPRSNRYLMLNVQKGMLMVDVQKGILLFDISKNIDVECSKRDVDV